MPSASSKFRLDIEGLRAIAIGSVLLFHAGLPWFPGGYIGVDIFFVISGFLITSLLIKELHNTGRINLPRFWGRRVRRLLPASALVLAFSSLVAWLWLPITQRGVFGGDVIASAWYVINWRLAIREVDYLAEGIGASPVKHYWSLAIEEQFYIVWPILLLALAFLGAWKKSAFVLMIVIATSSFSYAVFRDGDSQSFFLSTTRAWELGIGVMLAFAATKLGTFDARVRGFSGWLGLVAIGFAVLFFDERTSWPGIATLVPTLGTAALIAAGLEENRWAPTRLLSLPPLVWIGGLSYSLYLWHWPMLIGAEAVVDNFRIRYAIFVVLLSFIPAWLSYRLVENPIRHYEWFAPTKRALRTGAVAAGLSTVAGLVLIAPHAIATLNQDDPHEVLGAKVLLDDGAAETDWSEVIVDGGRVTPDPLLAPEDHPNLFWNGKNCHLSQSDPGPHLCQFGDVDSSRTIAILGDSKMHQWAPAVIHIAKDSGWRVLMSTKSTCAFSGAGIPADGGRGRYPSCDEWNRKTLDLLLEEKPDFVITSSTHGSAYWPEDSEDKQTSVEAMIVGLHSHWSTLQDNGSKVIVIINNPGPSDGPVYECVSNADSANDCSFIFPSITKGHGAYAQLEAIQRAPRTLFIDMRDVICPGLKMCPAVMGNVLIYRQGSHLTNTFVMTAEVFLSDRLHAASNGAIGKSLN